MTTTTTVTVVMMRTGKEVCAGYLGDGPHLERVQVAPTHLLAAGLLHGDMLGFLCHLKVACWVILSYAFITGGHLLRACR